MPLYKYVCPERIDIIQRLRIRFIPASEFNDPFEFLPDTSVLSEPEWIRQTEDKLVSNALKIARLKPRVTEKEVVAAIRARIKEIRQELAPEAKAGFVKGLTTVKEDLRILCLSRLPPDAPEALLMWAHYTRAEPEEHFREQLDFLRSSADRFDEGSDSEAKCLARSSVGLKSGMVFCFGAQLTDGSQAGGGI